MPDLFAIFHRYFSGDEALCRLLRAEFEAVALGAEVYPQDADEALALWPLLPRTPARHMVHLPRHWDPLASRDRDQVVGMAAVLAGRARGLVLHDAADWPERAPEFAQAMAEVDGRLRVIPGRPGLFLEYAAGLAPARYAELLESLAHLQTVSAGIDTGHVLIFGSRRHLASRRPGLDAFALSTEELVRLGPELATVGREAVEDLLTLVARLVRLGKPLHFHLHDAHLLSRWSPFPVRDHRPFGEPVCVPGAPPLPACLWPAGLKRLVQMLRPLPDERLSLTLEIHPSAHMPRLALGPRSGLFAHWTDLTHAEATNAWAHLLVEQAGLLRGLWQAE